MPDSMIARKQVLARGPDGKELTEEQAIKKKLAYKNMLNYTRNLLIEHRLEPENEVELKLNL